MIVLLADSGSTKTDWVVIENGKVLFKTTTIGFNPYFQTKEKIETEIRQNLKPSLAEFLPSMERVVYYGSGCSNPDKCRIVEEAIKGALNVAKVEVSHDLLAAARALCKREWGIAAILGTGSNSCLYDGTKIIENVPSTGYLWSDYGGGSQIGKFLIRDYFEGAMPHDLKIAFETAGYNREIILDKVYKTDVPSKYLASVSLFVGNNPKHPHILKVLNECFDSFFVQQINKYSNSKKYKIHMVGSVAFYYKELIAVAATKHGYELGTVLQSPMSGLIDYHAKE